MIRLPDSVETNKTKHLVITPNSNRQLFHLPFAIRRYKSVHKKGLVHKLVPIYLFYKYLAFFSGLAFNPDF